MIGHDTGVVVDEERWGGVVGNAVECIYGVTGLDAGQAIQPGPWQSCQRLSSLVKAGFWFRPLPCDTALLIRNTISLCTFRHLVDVGS